MEKAKQFLAENQVEQAAAELRPLEQLPVRPKGLAHLLGTIAYKQGDYYKASTSFKMAMEEDSSDHEAVQLRGLSLFYLGNAREAATLLEQVHSWYPSANVDATYVLGLAYLQSKDYERARASFADMFGVKADSAPSYLFMARMLLRQGYDPVAEEHALKAAAIDPKLPLVHYLLGELYLFKSRVPEATKEFETELALNPGYAGTYDRLADVCFRTTKLDESQRLLQRSILLDPNATGPYILMGKVLLKKNDPQQALLYLQRGSKMDPNNYMTHHLMGQAYRALNKPEAAERELKVAEQLQQSQSALK